MSGLVAVPISLREAGQFVGALHRHHGEPQGGKFAISAELHDERVGVIIAGRPVARRLDNGRTAEVTRLCTDGTKNACSFLYGAAAAAAKAMGYEKIITYTLESEGGGSLRASGWVCEGPAGGGSWSSPTRPREDKHPTVMKVRWSRRLRETRTVRSAPFHILLWAFI